MNFIASQTGKAIGKSMFNKQVTSCDGMDSRGPCCYEKKEAKVKKMNVCNTNIPKSKKSAPVPKPKKS